MDIKNALNQVIPIGVRTKGPVQKSIKSESTTDRDANGQQAFGDQQEQHREPMTEEQLKAALEHLQGLAAVKDHGLSVELIEQSGKKFVLLKEASGKVIRRIHEAELWTLQVMHDEKKGQILNKSA